MDIHQFLDTQDHKHIVLINEDHAVGRDTELQFIKSGLEKDQICLYATNNVDLTKNHMESTGINVSQFEQKGTLQICNVPKTFSKYRKAILEIVNDVKKYEKEIRLVSTHDFDFSLNDNVNLMVEIEQKIDDVFSNIPGNMICSFSLSNMGKEQSKEFIERLLDSHHMVILLQKDGTPKWFNLP